MASLEKLKISLGRRRKGDVVQLLKSRSSSLFIRLVAYFLLFDVAFVFLYPFLNMLITSVMTIEDLNNIAVKWVPSVLHFKNYQYAYQQLGSANSWGYWGSLLNSVRLVVLTTFGHVVSCSMVAYALARYHYKGRGLMFVLVLLTIIVPIQSIIVPQYIVYSNLHIVEGVLPLIIPTFFGFGLKGGLFVFIFRQFFLGLPGELEEAARIDGCGAFRTYVRIIMPVSKTAILVVSVLSIVWHWNDYFEPALYLRSQGDFLLPQMLPNIYENMRKAGTDVTMMENRELYTLGVAMAATVLVVLPVFILYIFLQRKFMEGVERTGIVG